MTNLERDAARYRWIRDQRNLDLRTNPTQGTPWTNTETGKRFYPSHCLAVNGTGFNGIEHLDDLIDQAMELYPARPQDLLTNAMPEITLEKSRLTALMVEAAQQAANQAYRQGWLDAAALTRTVAAKANQYQEVLLAVADSLEKAANKEAPALPQD